jgi:hypothetical protein
MKATAVVAALAIAGVLALLGAEIAFRIAARGWPLREWWNWEVEYKARAVDAIGRTGGASVVVVGSSAVQAGVHPELLTELVRGERPAFNAALNGAGASVYDAWARVFVLPRLRPEVVIIGVDSVSLNDNSITVARLYDRLRGSRAWQRLTDEGPLFRRLLYRVESVSHLVRFRRFLRRSTRARAAERRKESEVSELGRFLFIEIFRNRPYHAKDRQMEIWAQAVHGYATGGSARTALGRLVEDVRAMGARVALVKMPMTDDWTAMHPRGADDFDLFGRTLEELARERGVRLVDPIEHFSCPEDFADPVHLNGVGQEKFTRFVADLAAELRDQAPAVRAD